MEIVRTALSGEAAASFFSEFLGNSQCTLAEMFDWEILDDTSAHATANENTRDDAHEVPHAEGQEASIEGSGQTR